MERTASMSPNQWCQSTRSQALVRINSSYSSEPQKHKHWSFFHPLLTQMPITVTSANIHTDPTNPNPDPYLVHEPALV